MNKQSFSDLFRTVVVLLVVGLLIYAVYLLVIVPAPNQVTNQINTAQPGLVDKLTPRTAISIVLVLVALLAWMFWLTISFGRRLSERSYLGPLTRDALKRAEINRLEDDLKSDLKAGVFAVDIDVDSKEWRDRYDIPDGLDAPVLIPGVILEQYYDSSKAKTASEDWGGDWSYGDGSSAYVRKLKTSSKQFLSAEREACLKQSLEEKREPSNTGTGYGTDPFSNNSPTEGIYPSTKLILIDKEINRRFEDGYREEQVKRYQKKRVEKREEAQIHANRLLPSIDVSAFGGGWVFVLEFTTIIFIIFATLALGFVDVLGSEQIGTILAAIAGYVLGKSSSFKTPEGNEIVRGGEQPTAVVDILNKQAETRSKADEEKKALEAKIAQLEKDLGNAKVVVPGLVGKKYSDAEKELKDKGLLVSSKEVPNPEKEAGLIFEQIPAEKEELTKGSVVILLIAKAVGNGSAAPVNPMPPVLPVAAAPQAPVTPPAPITPQTPPAPVAPVPPAAPVAPVEPVSQDLPDANGQAGNDNPDKDNEMEGPVEPA